MRKKKGLKKSKQSLRKVCDTIKQTNYALWESQKKKREKGRENI